MINKDTAKSFEMLCNMSSSLTQNDAVVIWEPFGNPGQNKMSELDAPYSMFVDLAHNELIVYDFTPFIDLSEFVEHKAPFDLAGKIVWLSKTSEKAKNMNEVKCIKLTRTGKELRAILSLQWNESYVKRLKQWLNNNGVDLNLLVRRQGNKLYGTRL